MPIHFTKRFPRLTTFLILSVLFLVLIAIVSPVQLPVVLYKLALISLAAVLGYWLDRAVFPYARPDGYLEDDWRKGCDQNKEFTTPADADRGLRLYVSAGADYPILKGYQNAFIGACIRRAIIVLAVVIGVALGL